MKHPALNTLLFSFAYFGGTFLILYFNPRLDWISIFWLLVLTVVLGFLHNLSHKREEERILDAIHQLTDLLHSIEEQEERLPLEDDLFGVLRDEIYKSLVGQRHARDEAIKAKKQLKRNMEDVTHQIKTPLTAVMLLLDLLESDPDHSLEYQKRIRQEIERLYELSDLLLKLSSLDAGAVALEEDSFTVKGLIIDVELSLDCLISQKNIRIEVLGDDFILLGDRVWLMEALINLVKNAVEVSSQGDKVFILLNHNVIFQSISVRDYGPGLTQEQQKRVFERFYKSNPESSGFGIGLSLAQSIVEQHGGELIVRSSAKGSEFTMRFYPEMSKEERLV